MFDFRGDLQWNAGEKKLTGGANWQPKVAPATWSAGVPSSAPLVCNHQRPKKWGQFVSFHGYKAQRIVLNFVTDTTSSSTLRKYKQDAIFTKM